MNRRHAASVAVALVAVAAVAPASAHQPHIVEPGETLWSIAVANNFTTRALAASNGLSEDSHLQAGQSIRIPSEAEAASALAGAAWARSPAAPAPAGAYTVRRGDTLLGIAARSGVSATQVAWMNGLELDGTLLAGTALKLPAGASMAASPSPSPTQAPNATPQPTQERVTPLLVQQTASEHGVPPSLAAAIAEQESGFNNAFISPANARGVMQILPGTWEFVQSNLAGYPLDPASARDNVHAGVLYLAQLLRDTGGDEVAATASYYQGLSSVRSIGLLPETRTYVANVMALRAKYGG